LGCRKQWMGQLFVDGVMDVEWIASIPGMGVPTAMALSASVPYPSVFRSGRVPRQNFFGGKECLGRIPKMGDRYLRKLLAVRASSIIRRAGSNPSSMGSR